MAENLTQHYQAHGLGNDLLDQSLERFRILGENVSLGTEQEDWPKDHQGSRRVHLLQEKSYPADVSTQLVSAQASALENSEHLLSQQAAIVRKEQLLDFWQNADSLDSQAQELESVLADLHPASDAYQALDSKRKNLVTVQALKSVEGEIQTYFNTGSPSEALGDKLNELSEQGVASPAQLIDTYKQLHNQNLLASMPQTQLDEYLARDGQTERVHKALQDEQRRRQTGTAFDPKSSRIRLQGSVCRHLGDDPYSPRLAEMMSSVTCEDMASNSQMYKGLNLEWSQDSAWQEHQNKMENDLESALVQRPDLDFESLDQQPDSAVDLT